MKLLIQSLNRTFNKKDKYIIPQIKICIDCGSTLVFIDETSILCRDCGSKKILQEKGGEM